MARLLGPDMGSRYAYTSTGAPAAGATAAVYSNAGGTILADLAAYQPGDPGTPGAPIAGSAVTTDSDGLLPLFWFPDGQDRVWVSVAGGTLTPIDADNNIRIDNLAVVGTVEAYGAVADGSTDASAAIQAALDAAVPGSTVRLLPGRYVLDSPISVPPMVTLEGTHGNRTDSDHTESVLVPLSTFTGTAVIRLLDKEEGGYAVENEGVRLVTLTIDGSDAPASVHGVQATGRVHGAVFDRVCVQDITGRGFSFESYTRVDMSVQKPFSNNLWHCMAREVGSDGFWLGSGQTDSTLLNCESLGTAGHGFVFDGAQNSQLIGCRAEWSDLSGYHVTGSSWGTGQGSGGIILTGCSTDRNAQHGVLIDSTGASSHLISGLMLRRDGRNGGSGGGSYAGLRMSSSTTPIVVSGVTCYPGVDDGGAGTNSPQYAVSVTGSTAVVVETGYLHAATQAWHDGGTNTLLHRGVGVIGATGATGSATRETTTNLDITGRALGQVQPRDHGLIAWAYDPACVVGGQATVAGTVYLMGLYVPRPTTVSNIIWYVHAAAVTVTAGQNEVGLYSSAGTRLAATNVDSVITSQGLKTTAITPQALTPGRYWVGLVFNAGTPPQVGRGGDIFATLVNANLAASAYRAATNGTSQTALPASVTPASNTAYTRVLWCALN